MATPLWDALFKVATIAQLSGIHAFMLVGVAERVLRISCNRRARDKLQKSVSSLRVLLDQPEEPSTGSETMLRHSHIWVSATQTVEAAGTLLDEYRRSTLWVRVRDARSLSVELGDMHDRVKSSHCWVVLSIYGHLQQMHAGATILPPPALDPAITIDNHQVNRAEDLTTPYYPTGEGTSHDQGVNCIGEEGGGVGSQPEDTVGQVFEIVVM